jgi:hypothetical protein
LVKKARHPPAGGVMALKFRKSHSVFPMSRYYREGVLLPVAVDVSLSSPAQE